MAGIRIDDPNDGMLPANPGRRKQAATIGCATFLILLGLLIWFIATHTQTFEQSGLFGY